MKISNRIFTIALLSASVLFFECGDDASETDPTSYTVTISTMSTSATESDAGVGFIISLDRSNTNGSNLTINYSVTGTATASSDYQSPSGSAVIANGDSQTEVQIPLIDDSDVENDETIIISISASSGITLGSTSSLTFTISDNDGGGSSSCPNDNSIDQNNWNCDQTPSVTNSYTESISGNVRTITTNGIPTHDYRNQIPNIVSELNSSTKIFKVTTSPQVASSATNIVDSDFKPAYDFGVATNGVAIDPAPGEPFIFENTSTGEFNWDWVMEPNNNMEAVGLDCAVSHVQPDGTYHYHGDMGVYADQLLSGVSSGSTTPSSPVQIGWAADGFPILYKYGPDAAGEMKKLLPSYQLKSGDRPGNGVSEPCDEYNGKYTNDYEFVSGSGDLDACNGIANTITINNENFDYYYVITDDFPVISRCISGTPDNSFKKGG